MAEAQTDLGPTTIACETCERRGRNDGSWSKWAEPGSHGKTYHVCHRCLWSPRSYWNDLFSLCEKLRVGTTHIPRSQQSIAFNLDDLSITSYQQSQDISAAEGYQKFEHPFEHSPLDHEQIRILSLLPGGDDICCTIQNIDLNLAVAQYEALSYCWGSPEQSNHTIWVNGHSFDVSSNLYSALIQLRNPRSTRRLWIDAICINQVGTEGKDEKNTQIPFMGRIYHQAASVIVWLGAAEHDSDEILDTISQQNVKTMQTHKFAMGFGKLLKRTWFRRTWIVQEFVLGKTLPQIRCGSRTVSYGKFMAMHWVLPMLRDRFPDGNFVQLRKIVDSSGNLVSSKAFTRKRLAVLSNHDEAEKTLANLINIRRAMLDDEGKLRPRPLYKILPFIKDFDVTDPRDKIYGTFGIISPSAHNSVKVSYDTSVAEVYRDAMTYMLRDGKDEPGAVDLYLEYPLSLSLDVPTPGLPSWVPDFSQNSPFLRNHEDITWYWLHHQNLNFSSHKPLLHKQHGRHTVSRDKIDRRLLFVANTRLSVSGYLVDEVDAIVESTFFGSDHEIRDYSERQMNSSSEESQNEGRQIKSWLDLHEQIMDETIPELTTQNDDCSIFFASTLLQRFRTHNLYLINELCRTKLPITGDSVGSEDWLTFIWRDLLEGYSTLTNVSEEEFDEQFYDLAQSEKSITGEAWLSNVRNGQVRTVGELPVLNIPMRELFGPRRTFFTTATSRFYGISPPGVQKGDKLAFLFPQAYMAFVLRPIGEHFHMVGPCIVPPRLRDATLENLYSPTHEGDEFVLI